MGSKFEDNFWGDGNHGFEVLLQNMKAGIVASKELSEYIRERIAVEDSYSKSLSKLHKSVQHIQGSTLGGFAPLWGVITDMSGRLSDIHVQLVKMFGELNKEVLEYNNAQKEKLKTKMKGEVELAQESLAAFQSTDAALQRTKKQYHQSVEHLAKAIAKQKATGDPAKAKAQLESRVNQAKAWMETMKTDHQTATKRHCQYVMDFQAKMKEACLKFESLEEEHLAQMTSFMLKLVKTQDTHHVRMEQIYAKVNEQLNTMSVKFLLAELVKSKGTGKDKPVPYKFKTLEVPETVSLSASAEDLRSTSPRTSSRGEKGGLKRILRKNRKKKGDGSRVEGQGSIAESAVEVDEEGYSIRPEHAANIGSFPGDQGSKSNDWDSDSEEEQENRIKKITIRETSEKPVATVDDIKASVMGLRLGGSPGMKKATSSQSLNVLATPPLSRRELTPIASSHSNNSKNTSVASLMDIDLILSGGSQLQGIPSPLQPEGSLPPPLLGSDPSSTLPPWNLSSNGQPTSSASFALLPVSVPPLIPDPFPSSAKPLAPSSVSEPTLPKIVVPDKRVSPPPNQQNDLTPTSESQSISFEALAKPDSSSEGKPQLAKSPSTDKEKGAVPVILPPPRRTNTTPINRKTSSSSDVRVVSPLAVNTRSVSESPTNMLRSPKTSTGGAVIVPLAVAIQETCNAVYHGTDVSKCVHKVSGEIMMSFPSAFLGSLASSGTLSFKLLNSDCVEGVRHNQHLLKKNEADQYTFDMTALLSQLKQMKEKHTSSFYNVQLLKYEVKGADSTHLPVKLISYWKCDQSVTNFRLDCTYTSSTLKTLSGEAKPLTNVSVSVPVSGGVRNVLSKPTGNWNAEQSKMVWDLKTLSPSQDQATSLHAKFDVTDGPSVPAPAVLSFECDGATLSGLNFELCSSAYKISLLKFKCSAGKYTAEVS